MSDGKPELNPYTNGEKIPAGSYELAFKGYWDRWKTLEQNGQCHNCDAPVTETTVAGTIERIGQVCENCWKRLILV